MAAGHVSENDIFLRYFQTRVTHLLFKKRTREGLDLSVQQCSSPDDLAEGGEGGVHDLHQSDGIVPLKLHK